MNQFAKCREAARPVLLGGLLTLLTALPSSAQAPVRYFAQRLVEETLAKHRDLAHVVLHVTPPNKPDTDNVIVGSSMGRFGKRADDDDLRIMRTGVPEAVVTKTGDGFNVSLPLLDAAGKTIGLIAIGFPFRSGDDKAALNARAAELRDELRPRIPSAEKLFQKD